MKRLVIYFFFTLSFILNLNTNVNSAIIQVCDKSYDSYQPQVFANIYVGFYKSEKKLLKHGKISGYCTEYYKKDSKEIYQQLKELIEDQIGTTMGTWMSILPQQYLDFIERNNLKYLNLKDDEVVFGYERISKDAFCNQVKKLDKTAWGYPEYKVEKYCWTEEEKRIADERRKAEKKRIADLKKKREEEEKRRIADAKKKKEEEEKHIADAKKKKEEEERNKKQKDDELFVIGSGSGFFVSSNGYAVSNDHVVGICRKVASKIKGKIIYFDIISTDQKNDLGLLKSDYRNKEFLNIKISGAEFGEDIVAFGFPLSDALSSSIKLTRGIVSALSGPENNFSEIQIDAAIQPGNSGGPVINMQGQVVGVASSGLNKLYMLEKTEYIPENVNFAVAAPTLTNFLRANGVSVSNKSLRVKNTKDLAKIGRPSTLQLFCMNTKAAYEKLKKQQKHSDVLLEKVVELK